MCEDILAIKRWLHWLKVNSYLVDTQTPYIQETALKFGGEMIDG
jgi:hypothetical protein